MNGKELEKIIKGSGKTLDEIAAGSGISKRTLNRLYERPQVEQYYLDDLAKILKLPNVANPELKLVPHYDVDATAGNVTIFSQDGKEFVKDYIAVPAFADCEMFINVSGNSMYPKYCSGDMIALKRISDFEVVPYNEAYLLVTKELRVLKYIRKGSAATHWKLCSENEEFEPFEVPKKKVLHLYIVKGKITKQII